MKKYIPLFLIWISGTLLHFAYEISGRNPLVSLFAPINESVWEHYKLAFFPLLVAGLFMARERGIINMAPPIVFALTHACFTMFGINYFYTGALGLGNILFIDILNYYVTTAVGYWFLVRYSACDYTRETGITAIFSIAIMMITLWILTFYPQNLPIFIDFSKRK